MWCQYCCAFPPQGFGRKAVAQAFGSAGPLNSTDLLLKPKSADHKVLTRAIQPQRLAKGEDGTCSEPKTEVQGRLALFWGLGLLFFQTLLERGSPLWCCCISGRFFFFWSGPALRLPIILEIHLDTKCTFECPCLGSLPLHGGNPVSALWHPDTHLLSLGFR